MVRELSAFKGTASLPEYMVSPLGAALRLTLIASCFFSPCPFYTAEFMWLEQPSSDPFAASNLPWTEHSIVSGANSPGVFFDLQDLNGDGVPEVLYSAFFAGKGSFVQEM